MGCRAVGDGLLGRFADVVLGAVTEGVYVLLDGGLEAACWARLALV